MRSIAMSHPEASGRLTAGACAMEYTEKEGQRQLNYNGQF
jgi:hypothetical protein